MKELEKLLSNIEGLSEKLEKEMNMTIVGDCYCEGDIKEFMEEVTNEDNWKYTINEDYGDKQYTDAIAKIVRELELFSIVCTTKKIEKNRKDFKVIADELRVLADIMYKLAETKRETKKECKKDKSNLEDLKKDLKEMVDKLFE